ncbi:ROK family protein [Paenibacillus sp. GCM10023248]|uniref:ROK family protein n=1 Tax=Bacillales TaxID=1385 RepID=UPI0023795C8A|nr:MULTISPECIES: ROK family protein [Bacillales]MDD9269569.1 ROK family protein [Paenibacillus sp. MAHUQ-63]MDR6880800.1 glucokinase [Bacillus sp. 3255]
MTVLAAIDIGGTKCAVSLGAVKQGKMNIMEKLRFPTPLNPEAAIQQIISSLEILLPKYPKEKIAAIGVSCGGPLDSRKGLILSPPNLPGWDQIDIITPFQERFGIPVSLQNDANACALAEWHWGAGKGCKNMIFLTFGTGMGAGLILNGQLYSGTNDMAGEVGHIRLKADGPIGYGKAGSFEGFCSGGGIAQIAKNMAATALRQGQGPSYCRTWNDLAEVTAQKAGEAAQAGDQTALHVFDLVGQQLGQGLAMLIDLLNPERIVIGSIYGRQQGLLEPIIMNVLRQEALSISLNICEVIPSGLGEQVGDYAGLSVAMELAYQNGTKFY